MSSYTSVFSVAVWTVEVISLIILVVKIVRSIWSYCAYRRCFSHCVGETNFSWIYGNLHMFPGPTEEGLEYFRQKTEKFPKYYCLWTSPVLPLLFLHHPDTVKVILRSSEPKPRKVLGVSSIYQIGQPWLGEGLLISNGNKWHRNRHLLSPAFHFDVLLPYIKVINQSTDTLLMKIDKHAEAGSSFELFSNISECSLDILLQCAFSFFSDCQTTGGHHPFILAVKELEELWIERALKPYLCHDFIYALSPQGRRFAKYCTYVHKFAEGIINQRRRAIEKGAKIYTNGRRYLDLLDILLHAQDEDGTRMTDEEIRNEVDTFLFAGHDTTTSAICWLLYSLALHPEHQRRAQEEVDDIMKEKKEDRLEWTDLCKLEYLTACIKESMRLHSPVPTVQRITTKEVEIEGHRFPPNTLVAISIYALHHNPAVWDYHMEFDPQRFLGDQSRGRDPFAFLPFSAGTRNCIGQQFAMREIQILVGRILHRYDILPDADHPVRKTIGVTMRAENGIKLFARKRNLTQTGNQSQQLSH